MIAARRPLCAVCFRQPREEGTARCWDCGPGRIAPTRPRRRPATALDRAETLLGFDAQELDAEDPER